MKIGVKKTLQVWPLKLPRDTVLQFLPVAFEVFLLASSSLMAAPCCYKTSVLWAGSWVVPSPVPYPELMESALSKLFLQKGNDMCNNACAPFKALFAFLYFNAVATEFCVGFSVIVQYSSPAQHIRVGTMLALSLASQLAGTEPGWFWVKLLRRWELEVGLCWEWFAVFGDTVDKTSRTSCSFQ